MWLHMPAMATSWKPRASGKGVKTPKKRGEENPPFFITWSEPPAPVVKKHPPKKTQFRWEKNPLW